MYLNVLLKIISLLTFDISLSLSLSLSLSFYICVCVCVCSCLILIMMLVICRLVCSARPHTTRSERVVGIGFQPGLDPAKVNGAP